MFLKELIKQLKATKIIFHCYKKEHRCIRNNIQRFPTLEFVLEVNNGIFIGTELCYSDWLFDKNGNLITIGHFN